MVFEMTDNTYDELEEFFDCPGKTFSITDLCNISLSIYPYSIFYTNAQSASGKTSQLELLLQQMRSREFDIVAITETFFSNENTNPDIASYKCITLNRPTRGGGVAIYLKHTMTCNQVDDFSVVTPDANHFRRV